MAKQDVIEVEATVIDNLPNAMFKVELENIKQFYNNAEEFFKVELNNQIDYYTLNPEILKSYIVCTNFYKEYDSIRKRYRDMKFVLNMKDII